ncbi:MAG: tRNA pseudouridine(55) synthase TruB [Phormidium sp. GEM2.Bin31]|nr:MAG: tRNA pseudouridine(55) synthase TruB [Phormidium sp. GEM2.Bin31]
MIGFLNLNKPLGWTSHDCVAKVRGVLKTKKVGHGGTLDPKASGVLPLAVGRATRLLQYLPDGKAYEATVRFGLSTTTDDLEGDVITQQAVPHLSLAQIEAVIPQFLGRIEQIPPQYSAIQVGGKRLYDLARAGVEVEVPSREVEVMGIEVLQWQPGEFPELRLGIRCGGGTYIRAIARDLGAVLGTGATLAQLERTQSSGFHLADSISLEGLIAQVERQEDVGRLLFPPEVAISDLPQVRLPEHLAQRWCLGQRFELEQNQANREADSLAVFREDGQFLGIGTWKIGKSETDTTPKFAPKFVFFNSSN